MLLRIFRSAYNHKKNKITSSGEPCSFPHFNALMVDKAVTNVLFSFNLKKKTLLVLVDFGASCSPNLLLEDIFATCGSKRC